MTAVHGVVTPFDPDNDEYIERLQFYFANNIRDGTILAESNFTE